jgi:glutamyl-tRNA synthetase
MEISHILRAQEWLPSGSLHVLIYQAFGWEPPQYCHLPMVMGKDGQKLSKRHGSTSLREFREQGYLPEAVINYVSQVGWSYDDEREFFTKKDLEELFTLDKLSKSPGVFDYQKLQWYNGHYIREKTDVELKNLLLPYLQKDGVVAAPPSQEQRKIITDMIPLVKERLKLLSEVGGLVRFLFEEPELTDPQLLVPKKGSVEDARAALEASLEFLRDFESRPDEENEEEVRKIADDLGMKLGSFLMPLRVAVTGSTSSPPLFGSIRLLGQEKARSRVERALELLGS